MLPLALGIPISSLLGFLGVRVLRRAKKMGGLPDCMVGVFFLCMAMGTMPALLAGDERLVPAAHARMAMALGHAVLSVGFAALYVFAWKCFGPRSSWRRALALTGMAVLALLWAVQGLTEQFAAPGGPAVRATGLVRATALAWAFGESLRYRLMMRRRVQLGLADPVVANRFLLWSLWTGGLLAANAVVVLFRFLAGDLEHVSPALHTAVVICVSGLGLGGGVSLWLAFFPPPTYILRLRAGAA